MGGCRCTYRNCSVKTDGKTHMFHYPVFDKVRCHQWLVNAQRLDFLDLKVSQLKNRCVCQHHFREENFMNYKKEKLIFDAVPTLNGPFCDPSKFVALEDPKEYPIPILVEDIENDFDVNDKKSNFSLKYGDFLTNNDFVDSSARYNRNNINLTKDNAGGKISSLYKNGKDKRFPEPQNTRPTRKVKKGPAQPTLAVPPYSDLSNELKMGKELNLEQNLIHSHLNLKFEDKNSVPENICAIPLPLSTDVTPKSIPSGKKPKVTILSEKKIEEPIDISTIQGKFEIISPSRTLTLPDKSSVLKVPREPEITPNTLIVEPDTKPSEKLKILEVLNVEFDSEFGKGGNVQNKTITDKIENILPQSPYKKSAQIKYKVTPERSAAIEKKRKFNMKLKDIIESCLDKLDDPAKNYSILPNLTTHPSYSNFKSTQPNFTFNEEIKLPEKPETKLLRENNDSNFEDNKGLRTVQDSTIAYLEERMKKMESTLLNKIAQNSQQIIDFKNTWTKDSTQDKKKRKESNKRIVSTQTNENESCYKKYLYQEISKYLSPSSSSIIYEELFINKYSCEEVNIPLTRKRRKCI
ncbi:uncharacterized protein LOC120628948 isoform X1 [Pararge aegeria]|uniref:uncharacterized protein LOC120628948 isoform X1 n=1 Tax=Pararge aegeria TaxID=116150 RepID=UPI0019CF50DE|nr:uncharacterized protein LOC120628948 isoform X1 [Pararge aegeria]XP_039753571.1 uncharacterized protein LOC120628948 isoform X1 [Pararge aegeria]